MNMKKLLLLVAAVFFAMTSNAQIVSSTSRNITHTTYEIEDEDQEKKNIFGIDLNVGKMGGEIDTVDEMLVYLFDVNDKDSYTEFIKLIYENNGTINGLTENEQISKQSEEVCNTNLSEIEMLHAQLNCLIKEKEILMREKERDHQEIIYYRRMFCDNENDIATKNVRINRKREEDMISLFKSKEEDYMKEITKLQNIIVDRENEVECIKEQLLSEIHALKLENEKLHYNIEVAY